MVPPKALQAVSRRRFLQASLLAAGVAGSGIYYWPRPVSSARARILVLGGGAAGLSIAARLARALEKPDITLIDPAEFHDYQPGYTMVAAGIFQPGEVRRSQRPLVPAGVRLIQDRAVFVDAPKSRVHTAGGTQLPYDCLVLAPGLEMHFEAIEGISRSRLGEGNVHCAYDFRGAQKCWEAIRRLPETGGRALFTDTWTKVKCGGVPKKINFIAEDYCRRRGARHRTEFRFYTAADHLYDVELFRRRLEELYRERSIPVEFEHRVRSVDTQARRVTMERRVRTQPRAPGEPEFRVETITRDFDFLHIVPPMSAPQFVIDSGLTDDETGVSTGWVPVDKATLIHTRYGNILAAGDVAGIPTSKTAAAIRMQAPVVASNVIAVIEGRRPDASYDGYGACPFITEYGKVLMAEFDYTKKPRPTLPWLDPGREHRAGWILKRHVLKPVYFELMLRGLA